VELSVGRVGGGGGVAGGRGITLGRTAKVCAEGGPEAPEGGGLEGGSVPAGPRSGGGGGDDRNMPGAMPRDEGGGGMRELSGSPVPAGRGTTLTGRGATLTGAGGADEKPGVGAGVAGGSPVGGSGGRSQPAGSSVGLAVLESFSSPISLAARALGFAPAEI
jgi:hypothetical protein